MVPYHTIPYHTVVGVGYLSRAPACLIFCHNTIFHEDDDDSSSSFHALFPTATAFWSHHYTLPYLLNHYSISLEENMNHNRNCLVLFQICAMVIAPLLLDLSWSRQILGMTTGAIHQLDPSSLAEKPLFPGANNSIMEKKRPNQEPVLATQQTSRDADPRGLQIAWLMSYPNSGTTYTSHFIRKTTGTKTATNYAELRLDPEVLRGRQSKESIPVFDDQPAGPFWADSNETEPQHGFVLTKTHCGALCMYCPPEQYTQMIHHFRHRCLRSDKLLVENGTKTITKSFYLPTRVKKAVHLIRDPLDNVVSRFRYERMNGRLALGFNSTREDFRTYCKEMNKEFLPALKRGRYIEPGVRRDIEMIPCHAELVKWIEWHNMAFIVSKDLGLETFVLHYEDYSHRFHNITSELLSFLELKAKYNPPGFEAFKEYKDYFDQDERKAAAIAIQMMSLQETWTYISRYF